MNRFVFRVTFFFLFIGKIHAQSSCDSAANFQLKLSSDNNQINWQQFPTFSLPFPVIYGGPRFDNTQQPLKYGFSHLSVFNGDEDIPKANRAIVYYGTAGLNGQPWSTIKSPWGNNIGLYNIKWEQELNIYASWFTDSRSSKILDVDLLLLDVESSLKSNDSILVLKKSSFTPDSIKNLNNQAFINKYMLDMQNLYASPISYIKNNLATTSTKISSYADTPIANTFTNIPGNTYAKWISDVSLLNYLSYDFSKNKLGGNLYNRQDFLTPSAYYYYDFPSPLELII